MNLPQYSLLFRLSWKGLKFFALFLLGLGGTVLFSQLLGLPHLAASILLVLAPLALKFAVILVFLFGVAVIVESVR